MVTAGNIINAFIMVEGEPVDRGVYDDEKEKRGRTLWRKKRERKRRQGGKSAGTRERINRRIEVRLASLFSLTTHYHCISLISIMTGPCIESPTPFSFPPDPLPPDGGSLIRRNLTRETCDGKWKHVIAFVSVSIPRWNDVGAAHQSVNQNSMSRPCRKERERERSDLPDPCGNCKLGPHGSQRGIGESLSPRRRHCIYCRIHFIFGELKEMKYRE